MKSKLLIGIGVVISLSIFLMLFLFSENIFDASAKILQNDLIFLPFMSQGYPITNVIVNGVEINVKSPFMPGNLGASGPDEANQLASAASFDPFQELSILSAPFGSSPPIEDLPDSAPGGADNYRKALADYRSHQGGSPLPGPTANLFGQAVASSYSIVSLQLSSNTPKPTLIVEWVVESMSRLWIVRATRELSDGVNSTEWMTSLNNLVIDGKISSAQPQANTSPSKKISIPNGTSATQNLLPPTWWNGDLCDDAFYYNATKSHSEVLGVTPTNPLGATFDGLVACGPLPRFYSHGSVWNPGPTRIIPGFRWNVIEWQCVELAMRYLYLQYGIEPYQANGGQVVDHFFIYNPSAQFEVVQNLTKGKKPLPGDVISFSSNSTSGHVAIVTGSNVDPYGNGTIDIIEQNNSINGTRSIPVRNWFIGNGGLTAIDWLHPIDDMVRVPAGPFLMGCSDPVITGCLYQDQPIHTVTLDAYWIDKYEVTNSQYAKCVAAGGCTSPGNLSSSTHTSYFNNPIYSNYPVIYVDWFQSAAFCAWEGKSLPTEAQWEKAARGTDGRTFPWGGNLSCGAANIGTFSPCVGDTTKVGNYPLGASPYGVMDMTGNVGEWVNDWWDENYYRYSPLINPLGPSGPLPGNWKVARGGAWTGTPNEETYPVYYREGIWQVINANVLGFRCAR